MEQIRLRGAVNSEAAKIWKIIQDAIEQRRRDGSDQWQNGYPNEHTILSDIERGYGFVLEESEEILGYAAVIFGPELAYEAIDGKWLTDGDYAVVHRVARPSRARGSGFATKLFEEIEDLCLERGVYSIRVDTNFDNLAMLKTVERLGYIYCGEVIIAGALRKAYEKTLAP